MLNNLAIVIGGRKLKPLLDMITDLFSMHSGGGVFFSHGLIVQGI